MEINELAETKISKWLKSELRELKRSYFTQEEQTLFVDNFITFLKEI